MQQQAAALQYQIKNINLFVRMIENRYFMHHNLGCVCPALPTLLMGNNDRK
jgi:hypothetical protein